MKTTKIIFYSLVIFIVFSCIKKEENSLLIFAGSASKPPTEEIAKLFEKETGIKTEIVFGGSGYVLSQMKISQKGDIYFPGSSDYMEKAKKEATVLPETEKIVSYLVSAINVEKGNPKQINSLQDLLRDDVRFAIANPDGVCVGSYAVEIIEKNFNEEQKQKFKEQLVNYTGSCAKTATAISLKTVDAVIGWRVFQYWDTTRIETIPIPHEQLSRIGYIPIAVSKFSKNHENAKKFIDFISSDKGKAIFAKYNYLATPEQANEYIGAEKPVGGDYQVPEEWITE